MSLGLPLLLLSLIFPAILTLLPNVVWLSYLEPGPRTNHLWRDPLSTIIMRHTKMRLRPWLTILHDHPSLGFGMRCCLYKAIQTSKYDLVYLYRIL